MRGRILVIRFLVGIIAVIPYSTLLLSAEVIEQHYFVINDPYAIFIDPNLPPYGKDNPPINLFQSPKIFGSSVVKSPGAFHNIPNKFSQRSGTLVDLTYSHGAKHIIIGKISFMNYVIESDAADPLLFLCDKNRGYVYLKGKGTVTLPDKRIVSLSYNPLIEALITGDEATRGKAAKVLGDKKDPSAIEPLIASLGDRDYSIDGAAEALANIGKPAVDPLMVALNNKDKDVRRGAVEALRKIKDPRAIEPLIAVLKDEDKYVRFEAAVALSDIKDPRSVDPLIAALRDKDLRRQATSALGEAEDPRAVEPLIAVLKDEDNYVRRGAEYALGRIKDPRAVEPLAAALKDQDKDVRLMAAVALSEMKDPRAVEPLIAVIYSNDMFGQETVVKALGNIGKPAVEPLIAALNNKDKDVRRWAAEALGDAEDPQAVEPLIAVLGEDLDVMVASVRSLGKIKDHRAVEPLIMVLKTKEEKAFFEGCIRFTNFYEVVRALRQITGQDVGKDPIKWQEWWEKNKPK